MARQIRIIALYQPFASTTFFGFDRIQQIVVQVVEFDIVPFDFCYQVTATLFNRLILEVWSTTTLLLEAVSTKFNSPTSDRPTGTETVPTYCWTRGSVLPPPWLQVPPAQ